MGLSLSKKEKSQHTNSGIGSFSPRKDEDDHDGDRGDTQHLISPARQNEPSTLSGILGFSGRTRECPTCQGKGYLSQGQADSMVALIPIHDSRLKPKRTKLYLCLTFLVCVVMFSLVAFFLMPRSVTMELCYAESTNISITGNESVIPYIIIAATVRVSNQNYYKIRVSKIQTQVTWNGAVLNTSSTTSDMEISSKSKSMNNITITTRFTGETQTKVRRVCIDGWNWKLTEEFLITAQVTNLGRQEQISNNKLFLIMCYDFDKKKR